MLLAWLLLSFCMTGILQSFSATGSIINSALQLVSSSSSSSSRKPFYRVDEPRTWKEALWYCQEHYTDLVDLQSMNSPVNIMDVYSYTSSTQAWIGLFYDVRISGLRWSSGSIFTTPTWTVLPVFQDGICATLYSVLMAPALGAASCTTKKPFICYYDPAVGHRISLVSPLEELTTLPKEAEVKIGEQTFIRIKQTMSWLSALIYCRNHYTDLADLQKVTDKEGKETLHSITNNVDAWIGLYFNVKLNNLTWSSDLGSSIPEWLQTIPVFGQGLCAGLRIFSNAPPQIYALLCHELKPFICFWENEKLWVPSRLIWFDQARPPEAEMIQPYRLQKQGLDPSIGYRKLAEMPLLTDTSSPKVTHPSEVTTRTTSRPNTGISTGPEDASQALVSATWIQQQVSHEPIEASSGTCVFGICDTTTPDPTTVGLTALQPQGAVSRTPLVTPAPLGEMYTSLEEENWSGGEEVPSREKSPAAATMKEGTHRGDTATAILSQHVISPKHPESKEKPVANSEHSFGVLKADFTISTLKDPEEMKDQFLSEVRGLFFGLGLSVLSGGVVIETFDTKLEASILCIKLDSVRKGFILIQEVLKFVLGHEEFTLKWIGLEVNNK